jgi:hypothetical protein
MTKNKDEVAKRQETAVGAPAAAGGQVQGLGDVLPEQVDIPRLVLVQGMTRDRGAAQVGDWILRSTNRNYGQKIRLVPIAQFNTRGYFVKDVPAPMCTSLNGMKPVGGASPVDPNGKIHHECSTCYFAQRQPDPANPKQKLPAPCAAQINFLALVFGPEDEMAEVELCQVRLKRTAWKCGSQIITAAKMQSMRFDTLWGMVHAITVKLEKGKMGDYAVPFAAPILDGKVPASSEKIYPGIDRMARFYSRIWDKLHDRLAQESVDQQDGESVAADHGTATATAAPAHGAPPDDDLPF